jgi:MFS family permease
MPRRVLGVVAAVLAAGVLAFAVGRGWIHGATDVLFVLAVAGGLVLPLVAALRLAASAARDRTQWLPLAALVAVGSATSAGLGWLGGGNVLHFLAAILALFTVGIVAWTVLALELAGEYREPVVADRRMDLLWGWRSVLFGFLLVLSYPAGLYLQEREVRAAKEWVEMAAAEIRSDAARFGRAPHSLRDVLRRLPAPPRLVLLDEGYSVAPDGTNFEFRVEDPSQLFDGVWIYQGNGGHWRQEGDD